MSKDHTTALAEALAMFIATVDKRRRGEAITPEEIGAAYKAGVMALKDYRSGLPQPAPDPYQEMQKRLAEEKSAAKSAQDSYEAQRTKSSYLIKAQSKNEAYRIVSNAEDWRRLALQHEGKGNMPDLQRAIACWAQVADGYRNATKCYKL